eukprot:8965556-Alexandrium_andersonii.AAC.1
MHAARHHPRTTVAHCACAHNHMSSPACARAHGRQACTHMRTSTETRHVRTHGRRTCLLYTSDAADDM